MGWYIALELFRQAKGVQSVPMRILPELGENQDHLLRVGISTEPEAWVR